MELLNISRGLRENVDTLSFSKPVSYWYNPLVYAETSHEQYLSRFGASTKEAIFVGMNPGPFGMAQTGVPFGDVVMVRDWMGIETAVERPQREHPKRPIEGFQCKRREVSGSRLWGWAKERFGEADRFFERFFVWNYCPLCFMEDGGANRTPDKLPPAERDALFAYCDQALSELVSVLKPRYMVGVGAFAEKRISNLSLRKDIVVGSILHPSPASPKANSGWAKHAEADLLKLGIRV